MKGNFIIFLMQYQWFNIIYSIIEKQKKTQKTVFQKIKNWCNTKMHQPQHNNFFHTLAKVPLLLPAPKRECGIFSPSHKKSYKQHGDKEGHPRTHVYHPRLRLGCQFTRALDWPTLYLPCCVIYYLPHSGLEASQTAQMFAMHS